MWKFRARLVDLARAGLAACLLLAAAACGREAPVTPIPTFAFLLTQTQARTTQAPAENTPRFAPSVLTTASATPDLYPYPAYPTAGTPRFVPYTPTPVQQPSQTPRPTPLPSFSPADLRLEIAAQLVAWQPVAAGLAHPVYRVSQTPQGVVRLGWSPDGAHLLLEVFTGEMGMSIPKTATLVVSLASHAAWSTRADGTVVCAPPFDWSPDGKNLAFVDQGHLWLSDADGAALHPLPLPPGAEEVSVPQYAPDGAKIAVLAERVAGEAAHYDLWVYEPARGTRQRLIEDAGYGGYTWAPAGTAIALLGETYTSSQYPPGAARLWIASLGDDRLVSADLASLPGTEGCLQAPSWLVGDKVLATVLFEVGVWIASLGGTLERLEGVTPAPPGEVSPTPVRFRSGGPGGDRASASPDGRTVLYTAGGRDAYVHDVLTGRDIFLGSDIPVGAGVTWAPAGTEFLAWSWQGTAIRLVDAADGTSRELLPGGFAPAWSPDGQQIAYWASEPGGDALWLLDLPDRHATRLTLPAPEDPQQQAFGLVPYDLTPRWSPAGDALAFVSYQSGQPEAYLIHLRDGW